MLYFIHHKTHNETIKVLHELLQQLELVHSHVCKNEVFVSRCYSCQVELAHLI
jgi:hypothetical protein